MPRRPAAYPATSREQILALTRAGRRAKEPAQACEPSAQTIRHGLFQAEADRGERPGVLTRDERSVLVTTHEMDEAERRQRLAFPSRGHTIGCGTPAEVVKRFNAETIEGVLAMLQRRRDHLTFAMTALTAIQLLLFGYAIQKTCDGCHRWWWMNPAPARVVR
jgi:hypothetical protein